MIGPASNASAMSVRRTASRRLSWLLALVAVTSAAAFWLRDSSLVQVRNVEISGLSGPHATSVRAALTAAARDMTSLHVRSDQLRTVVEPYRVIASIEADGVFPDTMQIKVRQREPVGAIIVAGRRTGVAADGTILRGSSASSLPLVPLEVAPAGDTVSSPRALAALRVLGAAPGPLHGRVDELRYGPQGLTLTMIRGPELRFGSTARPNAKWHSAARVLADASAKGATYIDLRTPERPAAGGLEDPARQADPRASDKAVAPAAPTQNGESPAAGETALTG